MERVIMKISILLLLVLCFSNIATVAAYTGSGEQSIGFYSNGSLRDGIELADEGEGFMKLFRSRDRSWGSTLLVDYIETVALSLETRYPELDRLQVGDLSQREGGKISGHASHQNGLDFDGAFLRTNNIEQEVEDERGFDESFVIDGKLSDNFDIERNWFLIKSFIHTASVGRIFVDQVIKQALCDYAQELGEFEAEGETLRRLRHWPYHDDHFHLRLKCPADATECIAQDDPAEGSGCTDV